MGAFFMFRRIMRPGKRLSIALGLFAAFLFVCVGFTGCRDDGGEKEKLNDIPQPLAELIGKKKEKPFKLTYADGQSMYIVIGEGPQKGGGFSIAVKELYLTGNSVVIRTELMGPEKSESGGRDLSYPVLVIKTEYLEEPVVFR